MGRHSIQTSARTRTRTALAVVISAVMAVGAILVPTVAANAAGPAGLTIQKSATKSSVVPGETFNWVVEVGCSVLEDECVSAVLVDAIPPQFEVVGEVSVTPSADPGQIVVAVAPATPPTSYDPAGPGQTVTVDFNLPLPETAGETGLPNGIRTVTIPVKVRTDLPYSATPIEVRNTADLTADNAPEVADHADVTITIPLQVDTSATKSFDPATVLGVVGSATTVSIGGRNDSNSPVDSFTIQDPADPVSDVGIFKDTLRVDSLGAVTWPAGAESAVVSVWSAATSAWVPAASVAAGGTLALPAGVAPADIRAVRIAFASSTPTMQTGETAVFQLATTVRAAGSGAKSNTSSSTVAVHGQSDTATATQSLTLEQASSAVDAGKTISPDRLASVAFGSQDLTQATVTLTARNAGSVPLTSLTIAEPSDPADLSATNLLAPAHPGGGLAFQSFGAVTWPAGATAAAITYHYDDATTSTGSTSTVGGALPVATAGKRVTGFSLTFTGASMPANSQATVPFAVKTNPAMTQDRVEGLNAITVSGLDVLGQTPPPDSAQDDVVIYGERLAIATTKSITNDRLLAIPGQQTTATLTTRVLPYPESTKAATRIVQYDPPAAETGLTEWYRYFDPTAIVVTSVPGGATLTVQYRDGTGAWADVPGLVGITEPGSPHTLAIPSGIRNSIHGLRLVWDSPTGFVPGSQLTSNIAYQLRSELRGTSTPLPNENLVDQLVNCSSATGSIGAGGAVDASASSPTPCPNVDLEAYNPGPGAGFPIDKQFRTVGSNGTTVNATEKDVTTTRSGERTGVRLGWSTGGRTGIESMTITDAAVTAGAVTAGAFDKGMYDAFDLVRINAINNATDPYFQYDRVAIQAYNRTTNSWETPVGISCTVAAPCSTFNGYNLTAAQQELYVGVRFIYTERPGRTGVAQPAGAGVAASTGTTRGITLVYAIRDTLRSAAAVPVVNGPRYNEPLNGANSVVRNDVHGSAVSPVGTATAVDADTIQLLDANLQLDVTKTWTGGPIPLTGDPLPTSRVTLRTINQTPASTVSRLTIAEPNPDTVATENPFETFDLARIVGFTAPTGATAVSIQVVNSGGTVIQSATAPVLSGSSTAFVAAQGWTSAQLAGAVGITVDFTGRMGVNRAGQVQLDLSVRTTERTSGNPVTARTVDNGTKGTVGDLRYDPTAPGSTPENPVFTMATLPDSARANIQLVSSSISVTAGKSFSPTSQPEGTRTPITMTLTGTPGGSERVKLLTLTDDRSTFWNAFDLVGKGTITLPTFTSPGGAAALQVEVCTGGAFTATDIAATPTGDCAVRGGSWSGAGTWLTQAQLTSGSFLPAGVSAGDVQGIRLTVKRADDAQWENPQAPTITIPLSVQRRENLRSGGPVPSDYVENAPAPGETVRGTTTNGVRADLTGIWGGTATNSATATYRFVHLETRVQVEKLPVGLRSPGADIPYVLTVRNTGALPIVNPVITDEMPTDGTGAMLRFNPDATTSYTFAVSGGSVPSGTTPVPTGVFTTSGPLVTITPTTDAHGVTELEFTFPVDTVIGVGQTVTISFPLRFRPGLSANTIVENSFEVKGDRVFDACTAPAGKTATATSNGFGCETSTSVWPDHAPALRAFIASRADVDPSSIDFPSSADADSQYVGADNDTCRAAQLADHFSRPPCAPSTVPGQASTWRLTVENTGTTSLERLIVSTRLPTEGDRTIVSSLNRNSKWAAEFNGQITTNFGPGTTATAYYTTATEPCAAVLNTPTDPAACGTDPATGWALLSSLDPADVGTVTGLQWVVDYPADNLYDPAEIITVDIGTTTVAQVAVFDGSAGSDPLAVNSLSVSGITRPGSSGITKVSALDYSRALLSLATGGLTITKQITGPGAQFVPGWGSNPGSTTFNGQLVCDSDGESFSRPFSFTVTGGVISPALIQVDDLPGAASCTVTETAASGQTTATANTVIIDPMAQAQLPAITLTNDYQLTEFEVRKIATVGGGVDDDFVIPTGFEFEASCTFLGATLDLNGAAAGTTLVFQLDADGSRVISGIPVNAVCSVTETQNHGAGLTVVSGGTVAPGTVTEDQGNVTVTITGVRPQGDPDDPAVNWMQFDNRYGAGAVLEIEKDFAGDAAEQFGSDADPAKSFTIHAVCTFDNSTQFEGDVVLNAANGWSEIIENLLEGTECVFTEPALNGADAVVFAPALVDPVTSDEDPTTGSITIPVGGDDQLVSVTATNWFLTGAIEVTKTWAGEGAEKFGMLPELEYEFTLVCTRDGVEVVLPGGATRIVTVDEPTAEYTGIASGAACVLTETASNGATSWRVLDSDGDEIDGGAFEIEVDPTVLRDDQPQDFAPISVENTFLLADVSVTKRVDVHRADGSVSGPFEVQLVCTLDGREITAAEAMTRPVFEGQTVTWTELAAGAECAITETNRGGSLATGHRIANAQTGELGQRVDGAVIELAPLRPAGDDEVPNAAEFINTYPLPSTGSTGAGWLVAPAAALLLLGGFGLALAGTTRRRHKQHAAS